MPRVIQLLAIIAAWAAAFCAGAAPRPVYVGLDGEFGYPSSTSAEAIRYGIQIAADEINARGGVLGERPLVLMERANHSVPARSIDNIKQFAAVPDLVAVFCGRFSPTVLDALPTLHDLKMPLLDPWAAADGIIDNGYTPNYAFRLSMRDRWAIAAMLKFAERRKKTRIGLLLLNTSWGRSSLKAAEAHIATRPQLTLSGTQWFNWSDTSFIEKYHALRQAGAQAIILVSNPEEAAVLVNEMAQLSPSDRLPIFSHAGVTGGDFAKMAGPALALVDLLVAQTYSFVGVKGEVSQRVLAEGKRRFKMDSARSMLSPGGVAHAYDLTHILARAIDQAGTTDRRAIRDALEQVKNYNGLVKRYPQPFTRDRHEALSPDDIFLARYAPDGTLVRIEEKTR